MNGADKRMSLPEVMKTNLFVCREFGGVEPLNGHDAWALFKACAAGDMPKVKTLLAKDRRLVNAQFGYQSTIHMAVRAGRTQIIKLLLDQGAYPLNSWDQLLLAARERGHGQVEGVLQRATTKRFNYSPDFDALKEAIIARDARKVSVVLRRQPNLAHASDALGNNALHWSVSIRQLRLIERFAALGTPIDGQRADGYTPLLLAAHNVADRQAHRSHLAAVVGYLLRRGAK